MKLERNMDLELINLFTEDEVKSIIRKELGFDESLYEHIKHIDHNELKKEHLRFDMSGYEDVTGDCTVNNQAILNKFAKYGIYDYTNYLFLDFYKGGPSLYYQYFQDDGGNIMEDLMSLTTTNIIYRIFEVTVLSNKKKRRRS